MEDATGGQRSCRGSLLLLVLGGLSVFVLLMAVVDWQTTTNAPFPLWFCLIPFGLLVGALVALPRPWKGLGAELGKAYLRGTALRLLVLLGAVLLLLLVQLLVEGWP